jgi:hypothetical protein
MKRPLVGLIPSALLVPRHRRARPDGRAVLSLSPTAFVLWGERAKLFVVDPRQWRQGARTTWLLSQTVEKVLWIVLAMHTLFVPSEAISPSSDSVPVC